MTPIFHLSFPVRDLEEAIAFYGERFGAITGRRGDGWADIALFGAQVTLQHAPADVPAATPRTRHFGATLGPEDWQRIVARQSEFLHPPTRRYEGTDQEEVKAMISDPSGNLIELKTYRNPADVLPPGLTQGR